jgi:YggT family protein
VVAGVLINIIRFIAWAITLVLLVDIVLSYFMSPFSSLRMTLDRIVGPMLAPIRRVVPPIGGTFDISPIILFFLIQIVESILVQIVLFIAGLG